MKEVQNYSVGINDYVEFGQDISVHRVPGAFIVKKKWVKEKGKREKELRTESKNEKTNTRECDSETIHGSTSRQGNFFLAKSLKLLQYRCPGPDQSYMSKGRNIIVMLGRFHWYDSTGGERH